MKGQGVSMRLDPFKVLLDDAACRMEALAAVGRQLREHYAEQMTDPLPDDWQARLRQLATVEQRSKKR
jgi:hypothetical protein